MMTSGQAERYYHVLIHQRNERFAKAVAGLLRNCYQGHQALLVANCSQAARELGKGSVDFCLLDLDDLGATDLFFDVRTVFPAVGVLLTSALGPGERPALPVNEEARVLRLDADDCTAGVVCETIGTILGLDAVPGQETPEAASAASPQTRRVSGNLQILLPDLVQLKCLAGHSCVVEIDAGHDVGRIFFYRGNIVHANTRHLAGPPALMASFGWKNSRFSERPWFEPPARTIHERWETLLLQLSHMTDEANHRALTNAPPTRALQAA